MTRSKVTAGELLAGAAGVALVVALFGPWFDGDSAWTALTVVLVLLLVCALLGIVLLATTLYQRSQAYPVAAEVFAFAVSAVTTLVVVVELAVRDDRGWGAWLGLAAVAGVATGAWIALRRAERR